MNIYAIGNLTLDITVSSLKEFPSWGTEIFFNDLNYRSAGNLSNFSLALKKLGISPVIIGNVGNDKEGKFILNELKEAGLSKKFIRIEPDARNSITIALVREDGERVFLTFPGQLLLINKQFMSNIIDKIQDNSIVILCSLFQLPKLKIDFIKDFFSLLKEKKCITLLDTGWDPNNWEEKTVGEIKKLLGYVDYFLPNLEEAKKITNFDDERKILLFFKNLGTKNTIIKRGSRGCVALINNEITESFTYKTTCIDTTGAGDTFNAGIVYGLKNEISPVEMLNIANASASLVVSKLSNRYPNIDEVKKVIHKNSKI